MIEDESPTVFNKDYWTGRIIDWSTQNEAFKVEMFRFVDVFPYLTRTESVAKHLQEYFCRPEQDFPAALQWGLRFVSPDSMAAKVVAKTMASNIIKMAAQFILGSTPAEALSRLEAYRSQGMAFTVDLLGEAVVAEKEAEQYLQRYLDLLGVLHKAQVNWNPLGMETGRLDWGNSPMVNVSIKPSALYSQMNPRSFSYSVDRAKERLRPILRKAMELEASVRLDMEHTALKNLTIALYRSLMEEPEFQGYPCTGLALQSYLRDAETDLKNLLQWSRNKKQPLSIRLVKGAYWDAETVWSRQNNWPIPVFTQKGGNRCRFRENGGAHFEATQASEVGVRLP
jgi:RHH-type proline utilization regulon transcriptional repressor/proline dehydrogenase/delta 1-pyrroline-5-carboxylate dehydrogenase